MTGTPIWVYDNWGAYTDAHGGGFDDTVLSEEFALRQLDEIARLSRHGVRFDYYMMNAYWFEPAARYREWRRRDWPDGPDRWISGCAAQGVRPGMWFGTNSGSESLLGMPEAWADSLDPELEQVAAPHNVRWYSFSDGPFLPDFIATLGHWYGRGVRMFEFDFANFDAGSTRQRASMSQEAIREANVAAFTRALHEFRASHPDARLAAFNDFGGDLDTTTARDSFESPVDPRFLEVFDSMYVGDVRVSDVPHQSFWRSMDLYGDHMMRMYERNGIPLHMGDPFFILSTTWFGYERRAAAWRSQLLHAAARGCRKKTVYGELSLLDEEDALWFARVQRVYDSAVGAGVTTSFGGIPGDQDAYGFATSTGAGTLQLVVNPAPRIARVPLAPSTGPGARVLFADTGFDPIADEGDVTLGPGQLALVGTGRFGSADLDLGREPDVRIPRAISPLSARFSPSSDGGIEAIVGPVDGVIRVTCRRVDASGRPLRVTEFTDAIAERLRIPEDQRGRVVTIEATRDGVPIETRRDAPYAFFGGVSWAVVELPVDAAREGLVTIRCRSLATDGATLIADLQVVEY